ncbi:MAG: hypothetical protein AAGG75_01720 [Bacteroidota bacterium]
MNKVIYCLLLLALVSCNNAENGEKDDQNTSSDTTPLKAPKAFKILEASDVDLSKISYEGEIVMKRFWQDANGENIVLFTKQEDKTKGEADIFVYHQAINEGNIKSLQDLKESVKDCADADLFLDFDERAIIISDLDDNGFGEITFAYSAACVTDVSPHDLSLHLFENGRDYSLIGYTEVKVSVDDSVGGAITSTQFDEASPSFLPHANKIWERIKKQ